MFYTHHIPRPHSAETKKNCSVSLSSYNYSKDGAKMLFGALSGSMLEGLDPLLALSWSVLGRLWPDLEHS